MFNLPDGAPHPENPDALEDGPKREAPAFGDEYQPGALLTMDPVKAAKRVAEMWAEQDKLLQRQGAIWRANALRRMGHVNVDVKKAQDQDKWYEWSYGPVVPHMNKAATLCRKLVGNVFADPPAPQPVPASGDPKDIDAADEAERVLVDLISESQLDDLTAARDAFDKASTYGSGFVMYYVNPNGRKVPLEIEAHPQATNAAQPFHVEQPVLDPFTQQPVIDPATQQPATQSVEMPGPYVFRFVRPDGTLTDKRGEAAMHWVPKLEREVLTGRHVRFLPPTADGIWQADGVLIGGYKTVRELRKMFPDEPRLQDQGEVAQLVKFQPERPQDYLPGQSRGEREKLLAMTGEDAQIFVLKLIYTACPEYEKGAYLVVLGGELTVHQDVWAAKMDDGVEETLMLPLTQYMQYKEGRETGYGVASMELLGPGNEARAAELGAWMEHLDKFNSRKTFLPSTSALSERDLDNPTRTVLRVLPGHQPFYEEIPDFPQQAVEIYDRLGQDMDHTSGLEEAAQGVQDPNVKSGRHAIQIVAQVHAGLSELRQNVERASTRAYRIMLQLVRAYYTKPQKMRWDTPDGSYRVKRWNRSDLGDTTDVRIKPGTMTMLAPPVKIQYVQELAGMGLIPPDQVADLISTNLAATTGYRDEPHKMRIRRQIAEWEDGPPEGWQPVPPTPPQVLGVDAMGQPQIQPPQIADPVVLKMWEPTPADTLPPIAQMRLTELAKAMASMTYFRWPPEWRMGIDQEFQRMQGTIQQVMAAQAAAANPPKPGGGGKPPEGQQTPSDQPPQPGRPEQPSAPGPAGAAEMPANTLAPGVLT